MTVVTACGSAKCRELIHGICDSLRASGIVVLEPPLHDLSHLENQSDGICLLAWKGVTHAHFRRIALSDIVIMVNPGGYLGTSSTLELGYAVARSKIIIALESDPEPARQGLFDFVIGTAHKEEAVSEIRKVLEGANLSSIKGLG